MDSATFLGTSFLSARRRKSSSTGRESSRPSASHLSSAAWSEVGDRGAPRRLGVHLELRELGVCRCHAEVSLQDVPELESTTLTRVAPLVVERDRRALHQDVVDSLGDAGRADSGFVGLMPHLLRNRLRLALGPLHHDGQTRMGPPELGRHAVGPVREVGEPTIKLLDVRKVLGADSLALRARTVRVPLIPCVRSRRLRRGWRE